MPVNHNQTYNDARLDLLSREVFFKAMEQIKQRLDSDDFFPEKTTALAAVADAAACGFDTDKEAESEYD
jgi:hypothetical protein